LDVFYAAGCICKARFESVQLWRVFKPPCFGQRQPQGAVALEALADRLRVPTQPTLTALAALLRQVRVERFPTVET
jgi:hypothetical protein